MAKISYSMTRPMSSATRRSKVSRSSVVLTTSVTSSRKDSRFTLLGEMAVTGFIDTRSNGGAQILHDLHAGAGSNAIGPGVDHGSQIAHRANAAGRFHARALAHHAAHQGDIINRGSATREAGG